LVPTFLERRQNAAIDWLSAPIVRRDAFAAPNLGPILYLGPAQNVHVKENNLPITQRVVANNLLKSVTELRSQLWVRVSELNNAQTEWLHVRISASIFRSEI
jgi:hypothetical protein